MKLFSGKIPWYVGGLAFECLSCGRCCAGPDEGYVWMTPAGIDALAEHLKLSAEETKSRYVRRVGRHTSLREDATSKDCVFLSQDADGCGRCLVYPVRPVQCRTWPFWPGNLRTPDSWSQAADRCPGVNRGPMHDCDEIQRKRNQTRP